MTILPILPTSVIKFPLKGLAENVLFELRSERVERFEVAINAKDPSEEYSDCGNWRFRNRHFANNRKEKSFANGDKASETCRHLAPLLCLSK